MPKQILVVDDYPLFVNLVRDVFAVQEIDVLSASNASDALSLLGTVRPLLIISDFEMPGMDGVEFHSRLLRDERTKGIPFVFMTGSTAQTLMQHSKQHHLQVLSKSNLINELIELMKSLQQTLM